MLNTCTCHVLHKVDPKYSSLSSIGGDTVILWVFEKRDIVQTFV